MSHELRTPLNGIIGFAHLVAREGGITARQKERVEAILRAGRHLLEMITCVLEVSAVESDQISMAPIKVDVLAIANACLELMRPAAQAKHISLDIVVAQKIPTYLLVDPTRLRQVLVSLLSNAVKFTDNGSVALRVHVVPGATALRIEVADTGTGIPIEHQERLFRNFERGAGSVTTEGAGLGLALSARFVALMGGKIGHQDNPGGGSVFWLEFPLDTKLADSAESNGVGTPHVSAGPLHILVVDDTAMNLEITSEILRTEGHRVTCVAGGAAAVAAVAATPFDVVLMDVRMPEIDGLEATRQIRAQQGGGRRVPIVGLSAQALADQVAACLDAGMDDYLAKPFDPDTLLKTVARAAIANVYPGMA